MALDTLYSIRPAQPGDYEGWKVLWDGYNAFYGRHGEQALPLEVTLTTWARFLDPAEPMHALVAVRKGKVLGIAHYVFHRSTIQVPPTCYMQDLFTEAEARGLGIGRALIEAVYDAARAAGSPRVYWHTQATNATARRLYDQVAEGLGFMVYRREV